MSAVVVMISASCEGYGVRLFFAKLFSLNNNFSVINSFPTPKHGFYNHFRVHFLSVSG